MSTHLFCLTAMIIGCSGCWQEVRFDPDKAEAKSPIVQATATEEVEQSPVEPTSDRVPESKEPATKSESAPTVKVTTEDLFVAEEEAIAEASEPEQGEEETPDSESGQSDKSTATDEEVIVEEPSTTTEPAELEIGPMRPSRTALAIWRMSSRWSFGAAIYAKGQPAEQYRDALDQADYAANLAGAELPDLPTAGADDVEATVINFLLGSNPIFFDSELAPEYGALSDLAIKTHVLLLVYTPKSKQLEPLIGAIHQAAENSGLPEELWSELVLMLEQREPFDNVKREVLTFHQRVGDYLAGTT